MPSPTNDESEVRFAFGKNWTRFLKVLGEERIESAIQSLRTMLGRNDLNGMSFLDAGCGSGLFSLAARRLGARVHSFDLDQKSVACCEELRRRFMPDDRDWKVESGSVLDNDFLHSLGKFDVVYSWGVLHHTGQMWRAIDNVARCVSRDSVYQNSNVQNGNVQNGNHQNGLLSISIYNDQGGASRRWKSIKRLYNKLPGSMRLAMLITIGSGMELKQCMIRLVRLRNPLPFAEWSARKQERGMSYWHDLVDWVGGYPFEVAKPEDVFNRLVSQGFSLRYLTTQAGGYGCNEFVFESASIPTV